ncbi:CYFA0S12e04324g1_1 [Cyberlindnera fabianii]|uniref:CYFA0S12e04324g1_1 n=1 Tax=Cyberlindnera fabianii TaxID=36022 RepID=A0A061B1U0_CYBFA|nr:CYFA0S12e04324g1_1 [Cyberlindnera fabianii]
MNYDFSLSDTSQLDMSGSSATGTSWSNMNYYNQQSTGSSSQQNFPNHLWGKQSYPQSHISNSNINQTNQSFTPLTTAGSYNYTPTSTQEMDKLNMQLKIKESQIESLDNEIVRLQESLNVVNDVTVGSIPAKIPTSLNEVFVELSLKYNSTVQELEETKLRLESLITAMTLNPTNSVTNNGRYDELEISHKILIKMENLKKENEELMKQMSFGKVKQMDIQMNLLQLENEKIESENAQLKKKNTELMKKLGEM